VVRRILSDSRTFYKGQDYTDRFGVIFGEGLVTSNGEKHRKDRSIFGKFFIRSSVSKFCGTINEVSKHCIAHYLSPQFANTNTVALNIQDFFAKLTLRNFMNFALSTDLRHDLKREEELCEIVSTGSHVVGELSPLSWL
jgi:cytochrome P450